MKVKTTYEGKEIEVDLPQGYVLQTDLLANDELFKEAAEMRGINLNKKSGNSEEIKLLNDMVKNLSEQLKSTHQALELEKQSREEAVGRIKADKIKSLLDDAIAKGKILPAKRESWEGRLNADFEGVSEIINDLPAVNNEPVNKEPQKKSAEIPFNAPAGILAKIKEYQNN